MVPKYYASKQLLLFWQSVRIGKNFPENTFLWVLGSVNTNLTLVFRSEASVPRYRQLLCQLFQVNIKHYFWMLRHVFGVTEFESDIQFVK